MMTLAVYVLQIHPGKEWFEQDDFLKPNIRGAIDCAAYEIVTMRWAFNVRNVYDSGDLLVAWNSVIMSGVLR